MTAKRFGKQAGVAALVLAATLAQAQYSANNQTITIDGVTSNHTGWFSVGNTHWGDTLIVTNGGVLTNSYGALGVQIGASNNNAFITGSDSVWSNANEYYIGYSGSDNGLTVSGGGLVRNGNGYIGYNAGSSNNSALVTGAGSVWSNGTSSLAVGWKGPGSRLTVSGGGVVHTPRWIYLGTYGSSTTNTILITGNGSVLYNKNPSGGSFSIGSYDNRLTITDGGLLSCDNATIGGTGNVAVVDGPASVWSNSVNFYPGRSGADNRLVVTNGGKVFSNTGTMGETALGMGNTVEVTGGGSVWTNNGAILVGVSGLNNELIIANGGAVFAPGWSYIGQHAGSHFNTLRVSGTGSVWNMVGGKVYTGGMSNRLIVTDGGMVTNGGCVLNNNENAVLVTGPGSLWHLGAGSYNTIVLNGTNAGNQVVVSDGGAVWSSHAYIGNGAGTSNNLVRISGAGSFWTNSGYFYVGYETNTTDNRLAIEDGAQVISSTLFLGNHLGAWSNAVLVAGAGTVYSNRSIVYAGYTGRENRFTVSNAVVYSYDQSSVGEGANAASNDARIVGTGARWYVTDNSGNRRFYVGRSGSGNRLTIADGGQVHNFVGTIGSGAGAGRNTVRVTGEGSFWTNSSLYVGSAGSWNALEIDAGGTVMNGNGYVGNAATATGNTVSVTGSGSLWRVTGSLSINPAGTGNRLILGTGGVAAVSGNVIINAGGGVSNNVAGYSGGLDLAGSTLTVNGTIDIVFEAPPVSTGAYWGLRWTGDRTNALQSLVNAGALAIRDGPDLPAYWRGRAGIYADATYTYVGFPATRLPLSGTVIQVH